MKKIYNQFATGDGCVTVYARNAMGKLYPYRQFLYDDYYGIRSWIRHNLYETNYDNIVSTLQGHYRYTKQRYVREVYEQRLTCTDSPNDVKPLWGGYGDWKFNNVNAYPRYVVANDRGVIFSIETLEGFYRNSKRGYYRSSRQHYAYKHRLGRGSGQVCAQIKQELAANESLKIEEVEVKIRVKRQQIMRYISMEHKFGDWRSWRHLRQPTNWKDSTKRKRQWKEK